LPKLKEKRQKSNYWNNLEYLEDINYTNRRFSLPRNTKPCISNILGTTISKGDYPSRNNLAITVAVELRKNGLNTDQVERILREWNYNNRPPLKESEIRSVLKSSQKTKSDGSLVYDYGCNHPHLVAFCIDPEDKNSCFYYKNNYSSKSKYYVDYVSLGLQKKLTLSQRYVLFFVIPYLEKRRKVNPGTKIFVSVRELSQISGIDKNRFKDILTKLAEFGLIEYIPGTCRKWEKKATEIKRIVKRKEIQKTAKSIQGKVKKLYT
jgi:hypothetical protein